NTGLYRFYCKRHYKECKFKLRWDRKLYSEMFSFTSWTLFGQFTGIIRNQAVTVLINQFFNPVVVAARSIAQQVTNAVSVFSSNFNTSLYPPIIKEYSIGN
ncbi:MAG TPA: polysaccharide biosynthesis protein, partial [Treponema sp.]|nr:polysaccharide biosynthesis protein [Treponema sp.]